MRTDHSFRTQEAPRGGSRSLPKAFARTGTVREGAPLPLFTAADSTRTASPEDLTQEIRRTDLVGSRAHGSALATLGVRSPCI
jgi:hypothetical protein